MKPINIKLVVILACLMLPTMKAWPQQCVWTRQSQGQIDFVAFPGVTSTSDGAGNIYITGTYRGSVTFGTTTLYSMSAIAVNLYVVKYDSSGNIIWAKTFGGVGRDASTSITCDNQGNLYLYGVFSSPAISFGAYTLSRISSGDFFLVKLDSTGSPLWAKTQVPSSAGDPYADILPTSVRTDNFGGVVVSGRYRSSLLFGSTSIANPVAEGGCYIARYDTAGNFQWARTSGGNVYCYEQGLTIDLEGNIYAGGYYVPPYPSPGFYMTISFDTVSVTSPTGSYLFLSKLDVSGNLIWFKSIGNGYGGNIFDMGTDGTGNLYIAGFIEGDPFMFDTIALHDTAGFNVGEAFLAKYDGAGHALWAKSPGGNSFSESCTIHVDKDGNSVMGGVFSNHISFGSTGLDNADFFLTKYSTGGNVFWAKEASNPNSGAPISISCDASGAIYVAGYFFDSLLFDTCRMNALPTGARQVFVARFNDLTERAPLAQQQNNDMLLFPNPSANRLNIQSNQYVITKVLIADMMGHVVRFMEDIGTRHLQIDVSDLPAGVYLIRINDIEVRRFVKQ